MKMLSKVVRAPGSKATPFFLSYLPTGPNPIIEHDHPKKNFTFLADPVGWKDYPSRSTSNRVDI